MNKPCPGKRQSIRGMRGLPRPIAELPTIQPAEQQCGGFGNFAHEKDHRGDFLCLKCGTPFNRLDLRTFSHTCNGNGAELPFVRMRRRQCQRCPKKEGGQCTRMIEVLDARGDEPRECSIDVGSKITSAWCPDDDPHWLAVEMDCPQCSRRLVNLDGVHHCCYCGWKGKRAAPILPPAPSEKTELPGTVISICDAKFDRMLYVMLWSLLRQHRCKIAVYDVGLASNPMLDQMRSWGVEFRHFDRLGAGSHNQQVWFTKPRAIADAMQKESEEVLYLDADIIITKPLTDLYDMMARQFCVPNHGHFVPPHDMVSTPEHIRFFLDVDNRNEWDGNRWPCTGIVGTHARRDKSLVYRWVALCEKAEADPIIARQIRWGDQNLIYDLMPCETIDGHEYNNFLYHPYDPLEVIWQAFDVGATISHFAGVAQKQSFDKWPKVLKWPDP